MEEKKITSAINAIQKVYGSTAIINMGEAPVVIDQSLLIDSGSIKLNEILGGGYRKGRIYEIFGPESSGKTTLALHAMVAAQKHGDVLYVDTENAFDPNYARSLGVDLTKLWVAQPDFAEEAFEIIEAMVATGEISMFVVDSVAGLSPKAEMEGEAGDSNMGLIARFMGQHLRKVKSHMKNTGSVAIYINQIRMKIGTLYGSPETTTGGNALKFFSSVRIDVRTIKREIEKGYNRTRAKTVKNKLTTPFREAEFDIVFGKGIDRTSELLELAEAAGIVQRSGAWYAYGSDRLGQGKANTVQFLEENKEILDKIKGELNASV